MLLQIMTNNIHSISIVILVFMSHQIIATGYRDLNEDSGTHIRPKRVSLGQKAESTVFTVPLDNDTVHDLIQQINNNRKRLDATNMVYVKWDPSLADDIQRDSRLILKRIGCQSKWNCDTQACDSLTRFLIEQPGLYQTHLIYNKDHPFRQDIDQLYRFLTLDHHASLQPCGERQEYYRGNRPECTKEVYKIYSYTSRVGCTRITCSEQAENGLIDASTQTVCKFEAFRPFRPAAKKSTVQELFRIAKSIDQVCSECPDEAPVCYDNLCHQSAMGTKASLPVLTIMSLYFCFLFNLYPSKKW